MERACLITRRQKVDQTIINVNTRKTCFEQHVWFKKNNVPTNGFFLKFQNLKFQKLITKICRKVHFQRIRKKNDHFGDESEHVEELFWANIFFQKKQCSKKRCFFEIPKFEISKNDHENLPKCTLPENLSTN